MRRNPSEGERLSPLAVEVATSSRRLAAGRSGPRGIACRPRNPLTITVDRLRNRSISFRSNLLLGPAKIKQLQARASPIETFNPPHQKILKHIATLCSYTWEGLLSPFVHEENRGHHTAAQT